MRRAPLAVTEDALALLGATYADAVDARMSESIGRIQISGVFGVHSGTTIREESAVFRMISIVEAYVDAVGHLLFVQELIEHVELFATLVAEAASRATDNWNARKTAFSDYHKMPLTERRSWAEVDAFILVRNSIAHGLGRLTDRQRNPKSVSKLKVLGIDVVDGRLIFKDGETLRKCLMTCRTFVSDLDNEASMRFFGSAGRLAAT